MIYGLGDQPDESIPMNECLQVVYNTYIRKDSTTVFLLRITTPITAAYATADSEVQRYQTPTKDLSPEKPSADLDSFLPHRPIFSDRVYSQYARNCSYMFKFIVDLDWHKIVGSFSNEKGFEEAVNDNNYYLEDYISKRKIKSELENEDAQSFKVLKYDDDVRTMIITQDNEIMDKFQFEEEERARLEQVLGSVSPVGKSQGQLSELVLPHSNLDIGSEVSLADRVGEPNPSSVTSGLLSKAKKRELVAKKAMKTSSFKSFICYMLTLVFYLLVMIFTLFGHRTIWNSLIQDMGGITKTEILVGNIGNLMRYIFNDIAWEQLYEKGVTVRGLAFSRRKPLISKLTNLDGNVKELSKLLYELNTDQPLNKFVRNRNTSLLEPRTNELKNHTLSEALTIVVSQALELQKKLINNESILANLEADFLLRNLAFELIEKIYYFRRDSAQDAYAFFNLRLHLLGWLARAQLALCGVFLILMVLTTLFTNSWKNRAFKSFYYFYIEDLESIDRRISEFNNLLKIKETSMFTTGLFGVREDLEGGRHENQEKDEPFSKTPLKNKFEGRLISIEEGITIFLLVLMGAIYGGSLYALVNEFFYTADVCSELLENSHRYFESSGTASTMISSKLLNNPNVNLSYADLLVPDSYAYLNKTNSFGRIVVGSVLKVPETKNVYDVYTMKDYCNKRLGAIKNKTPEQTAFLKVCTLLYGGLFNEGIVFSITAHIKATLRILESLYLVDTEKTFAELRNHPIDPCPTFRLSPLSPISTNYPWCHLSLDWLLTALNLEPVSSGLNFKLIQASIDASFSRVRSKAFSLLLYLFVGCVILGGWGLANGWMGFSRFRESLHMLKYMPAEKGGAQQDEESKPETTSQGHVSLDLAGNQAFDTPKKQD